MRYAEYLPSPRLAAIVERLWILEGPGEGIADAILPDGRIEIIFHCGAPFRQHLPSGAVVIQPSALLAGQILSPISLSHVGAARVVAIRLRPWSARVLVRDVGEAVGARGGGRVLFEHERPLERWLARDAAIDVGLVDAEGRLGRKGGRGAVGGGRGRRR